jgi:D-alanine-D-alanine ligase
MQIPYTGCSATPYVATSNKVEVKRRLVEAGLPTPAWITDDRGMTSASSVEPRIADCGSKQLSPQSRVPSGCRNPQFILKPVLEHASFAMDDDSVISGASPEQILDAIREREAHWQRPYFAEKYIEGREFNLSLLGSEPTVLPPAEIDFSAFPQGKPRIVGQRAKFHAGSFEFDNTPRRFNFPPSDELLLGRLRELAIACWRLFGLSGYARVDIRSDADGEPWILEINANPCLAPSSGFAAALAEAGIDYDTGIEMILADAQSRAAFPGRYEYVSHSPHL